MRVKNILEEHINALAREREPKQDKAPISPAERLVEKPQNTTASKKQGKKSKSSQKKQTIQGKIEPAAAKGES